MSDIQAGRGDSNEITRAYFDRLLIEMRHLDNVLPEIARAVKGQMRLIADCGIADSSDIYKALALGADAACVGRAILPAMRADGARGVKAYLRRMNDELRGIMARTGASTPAHVDPSTVRPAY